MVFLVCFIKCGGRSLKEAEVSCVMPCERRVHATLLMDIPTTPLDILLELVNIIWTEAEHELFRGRCPQWRGFGKLHYALRETRPHHSVDGHCLATTRQYCSNMWILLKERPNIITSLDADAHNEEGFGELRYTLREASLPLYWWTPDMLLKREYYWNTGRI